MRYVFAMAMLMTLAGPVHAQFSNDGGQKTPLQLKYEREEQEQRENARQYELQMKRLKAQAPTQTNNDPWRQVRPSTDSAGKR